MPNPIAALPIIDKLLSIFQEWQKNRPAKKLEYRVAAAMEYVFLVEKGGEYTDIDDDKRKDLMLHFRKRIFDA